MSGFKTEKEYQDYIKADVEKQKESIAREIELHRRDTLHIDSSGKFAYTVRVHCGSCKGTGRKKAGCFSKRIKPCHCIKRRKLTKEEESLIEDKESVSS